MERWRDVTLGGCLALSAMTLALAAQRPLLMAPFGVAALLAAWVPWRGAPKLGLVGYLLLLLPWAFGSSQYPVPGISGLDLNVPWHIAGYMLCLGLLWLYGPHEPRRVGAVVLHASAGIAANGADLPLGVYLPLVVCFLACALLAARAAMPRVEEGRGPSVLRIGVWVGVWAALSGGVSLWAHHHYEDVRQDLFFRGASRGAGRLSQSPRLGSVDAQRQGGGKRSITLRAYAAEEPGHLRAFVYTRYRDRAWTGVEPRGQEVLGSRVVVEGRTLPGGEPDLEVYPTDANHDRFFLPLTAAAVRTSVPQVQRGSPGALTAVGGSTARGYGVWRTEARWAAGAEDPVWMEVPEDPELVAALDGLLERSGAREAGSGVEAAAALARWFADHYTYRYGIAFQREPDPLVQFLTSAEHGHCELFASAGALALRRLGIPARYVTGFVCAERNAFSEGLWVARNEHAHAWVEVYDQEEGWSLAELTPPSGQPSVTQGSSWEGFREALSGWFERARGAVKDVALRGLVWVGSAVRGGALALLGAPWVWAVVGVGVVVGVLWRRRRGEVRATLGPALEAERRAYLQAAAVWAKRGMLRRDAETLLEFAGRLEGEGVGLLGAEQAAEAAARTRAFAGVRYRAG